MKGNVMKRLMLWFLLAVLFLPAVPSWAADGGIDTTFGTGGKVVTDFMARGFLRRIRVSGLDDLKKRIEQFIY